MIDLKRDVSGLDLVAAAHILGQRKSPVYQGALADLVAELLSDSPGRETLGADRITAEVLVSTGRVPDYLAEHFKGNHADCPVEECFEKWGGGQ